jgi:DNA polymerase III subunit chi
VTRVDFYTEASDRLELACKLAHKVVQSKARMLVFVPDAAMRARLDQMLWLNPPIGFVPHCSVGAPVADETPILLAPSVDAPPIDDILLNLSDEWPPTFARFHRLIEIVTQAEDDKALARARYRFYRDRGYPIETHNLLKLGRSAPG